MIYYGVNPYHFWCGVVTTLILEYLAFLVAKLVLRIRIRRLKKKLKDMGVEVTEDDES